MANKKNTSKKKSTTSKSAKNKKQREEYIKKIDSVGEFDTDYRRIILIAGIIIIIFCLFYFLTVYITGRDSKKNSSTDTESTSSISYTDILAGRSFSMPENEYLVLYYDYNDEDISSEVRSLSSDYRETWNALTLYSVDMSDSINQQYISDQSNAAPSSISELAIQGATLIHFKEGHVEGYYEGIDEIKEYFA